MILHCDCRWHKAVDKVQAALPAHVTVKPWRMHIFSQLPYPDNYKAFKQKRGSQLEPIEKPQRLPALPSGLSAGQMPSLAELEAAVAAAFSGRQASEVKPNMHLGGNGDNTRASAEAVSHYCASTATRSCKLQICSSVDCLLQGHAEHHFPD